MFLEFIFVLYFVSLILFSLVTHPIYYCGLLVFNSLISSVICYYIFGFSWYSLLLCLVYIGGVYILFIFISVFNPNNSVFFGFNLSYNNIIMIFFLLFIMGLVAIYSVVTTEFSSNLCTLFEGNFYICMCLTLILGFIILSLISSIKFNHYR